jgi:2-polyprenyl-3-methyl-5-hydroxy-6-metoxy-1,4-benzoquinol methylase
MSFDPYNRTDELSTEATGAIAARLEARGESLFFSNMIDEYLAEMDVPSLTRVLDVGCGTGVAALRLASRPDFRGTVVGVDRSAGLIEIADAKASEEGLTGKVTFEVGDATSLSEISGRFDAALAHTLVSHVDNARSVLAQIVACVRPGGLIAIFDGDYASWVYGGDHPEAGEMLAAAVVNAIVTNATVMRCLPADIRSLGLQIVAVKSYVLSEVGEASFFASSLDSYPTLLPVSGVADKETVEKWVDIQRGNSANGTFFGSINFYAYVLRCPE